MLERLPDTSIRVISQGYNFWKVQVLFSGQTISSGEIPDRLRDVKAELALQFGVPDSLLEYVQLLSKKQTRNGTLVEMQIVKHSLPNGAPRFRSLPVKAPDGSLFSDMVLELDLYPLDEFERPLVKATVRERLAQGGVELGSIKWELVDQAIAQMEETGQPVFGLKVAEGTLPDFGKDSQLIYAVSAEQEPFMPSAWMGVRPVGRGDFVVEVTHAVSGLRRGFNLKGRELEARSGISTTIEAGEGARLSMRETKLISAREGLLVFERFGRDKRQKDQRDTVPAKLVGKVLPMLTFDDSIVFELEMVDAAQIIGKVKAGSKIKTLASLYIQGDIEEGSEIECGDSLRIWGNVKNAEISAKKHLAIIGTITDSVIEAGLTLQIDGVANNSTLYAMDVIAQEVTGGYVEALSHTRISNVENNKNAAASVKINLQKFLEIQQQSGKQAIDDLRDSLTRLIDVFGPEIALQVNEGSMHRMLLKWLREQKAAGAAPYTYAEVQEFRTLLELIPTIREQLTSVGMELREITDKLSGNKTTETPATGAAENSVPQATK